MSEAKKIVAAIEPDVKKIREELNKLGVVRMTDEQYDAWVMAKRRFNEWLFADFAELQEKSGLKRIKVEESG